MYCKCFSPGVLREMKKDIEINYNDKIYKIPNVIIKKCNSSVCKQGFIPKETWSYVTHFIEDIPDDEPNYALASRIFKAFKEE